MALGYYRTLWLCVGCYPLAVLVRILEWEVVNFRLLDFGFVEWYDSRPCAWSALDGELCVHFVPWCGPDKAYVRFLV